MNNIEWRDVPGYEGLYQVSSTGFVKSLRKSSMIMRPYIANGGYYIIRLAKGGVKKHYLVHRLVALAFIPNPDGKPFIDHINTNRIDNRVENLRWCTVKENFDNPITRDHLHNAMIGNKRALGYKYPKERNKKISDALKGRPCPEERKKKISDTLTGRPGRKWSEEMREKMIAALTGKKKPRSWVDSQKKAIIQHDMDGNYIREWPSVFDAAVSLGIKPDGLYKNVRGITKSSNGFVWTRK